MPKQTAPPPTTVPKVRKTAKKPISNNKIMLKLLKIEKEIKEFREVKKQIDKIILDLESDSE